MIHWHPIRHRAHPSSRSRSSSSWTRGARRAGSPSDGLAASAKRIPELRLADTGRSIAVIAALLVSGVALTSTPALAQVWQASADYSSVQGDHSWYYMSFNTSSSTYAPLVYGYHVWTESWHGVDGLGDIGVDIFPTVIHPGGRGHEAARVWESPIAGTVRVTGRVAEADGSPRNPAFRADGVRASIWKDGQILFSVDIADRDLVGYDYDLFVHVMPGDRLIFRSQARANSNYDSTYFDPRIVVQSLDGENGGSWIASVLGELSAHVAELDPSLFPGPVDSVRLAHQQSLAHALQVAANLASLGQANAAREPIANAIWRLDGDDSPPDWLIYSPQKQSLLEDIVTLWVLLGGP